jgi:lysozyme
MSRHINQKSLDLIKSFEGFYPRAYKCPAGVWTIGYGTTSTKAGGHDDGTIHDGMVVTVGEAEEFLRQDLEHFERVVDDLVRVDINDDMFGALVSFAYNCGEGNLKSSTLLRKLNDGEYDEASEQFLRWNKARNSKGRLVPLNGLTRRRASEGRLFEGHDDPVIASVNEMGKLGYPVS